MKLNHAFIAFFLLCILALTGLWIRYDNLTNHFTHIDDLLVASNLMKKNNVEEIHEAIASGDSLRMSTYKKRGLFTTLYSVKDSPFLDFVTYHYLRLSDKFNYVSKVSTYAPLQCGMTSWWVHTNDTSGYETIKTKGRFLSFVFGSFSIIGIMVFVYYLNNKQEYGLWLALFAGAVMVFSWENIVYSQQMEPYTIVVFFHILLLGLLVKIKPETSSWKSYLLVGLVLGFLVRGQYQMMFTGAAFIATFGFMNLRSRWGIFKTFLMAIGFVVMVFPLLSFLENRTDGGVNWNAGQNGEFLFSSLYKTEFDWVNWTKFLIEYFFKNLYFTARALIGFMPDESAFLVNVATSLLLILSLTGMVAFFLKMGRDETRRKILIYSILLSGVWVSLILLGKITLSPTRHSMVLLPILLLFAAEGLLFLLAKNPTFLMLVCIAWTMTLGTCFAMTYQEEKAARQDIFSEKLMDSLLTQYRPDLVLSYGFTDNVRLYSKAASILHAEIHSPYTTYMEYDNNKEQFDREFAEVQLANPDCILMLSTRSAWDISKSKYFDRVLDLKMAEYSVVLTQEFRSFREIEYSKLTSNGTNQLFYYVLKKQVTPEK